MTPLCHRTLAFDTAIKTVGSPCIGSRCALWATYERDQHGVANTVTGKGWCSENMNREPWPDPAKAPE